MKIKVENVKVRDGRRMIDQGKVKKLAASIKEVGLINPITLTRDNTLVAGAHRLEAFKYLGCEYIEASLLESEDSLKIELAEIDENLVRNELHWTEQDDALARRKEIYEELYPETKKGAVNQYTKVLNDKMAFSKSFTDDAAEKIGTSKRNVERSIHRSTNIDPALKPRLKELDLTKTEGSFLAKLEPEKQKAIIETKASRPDVSVKEVFQEMKKEAKIEMLAEKKEENKRLDSASVIMKPKVYIQDYTDFLRDKKDFDLLLTDPPYSTDIDNINGFVNDWLPLALSTLKNEARGYICIGAYPKEVAAYVNFFLRQNRFILDSPLIWSYRNTLGVTPKSKYNLNYQMILHFYSENSKSLDTSITNEMFSVQEINAPDGRIGNRYHRWQKPSELARRLITHSTNEKDKIIDPFAGSGTFLVEAGKMNRFAVGCDIDIRVIELLKERGCDVEI